MFWLIAWATASALQSLGVVLSTSGFGLESDWQPQPAFLGTYLSHLMTLESVFQLLCFSTAPEPERINPLNKATVPAWGHPSTWPQFQQAGSFRTKHKQNWLFGSWDNKTPDYSANSAVLWAIVLVFRPFLCFFDLLQSKAPMQFNLSYIRLWIHIWSFSLSFPFSMSLSLSL